jgi:hypothetical protein
MQDNKTMAVNQLREFGEVLADFRQLSSVTLKGVFIVPMATIWLNVAPPPVSVTSVSTSTLELLAAIWVFQFWYKTPEPLLERRMKIAILCFSLGLVCFLFLNQSFVVSPGSGQDRVIEGFSVRPDVAAVLNSTYRVEDALRDGEYDPQKVWTEQSIAIVKNALLLLWIFTFISLAVSLTIFVVLQKRRSALPVEV